MVLPGSLTFTSQQTGVPSGAELVTVSNTGTGPLTFASIAASGDFSETHNCPTTIAPGNGCTIRVVFKPSEAGARSASLTITDDATSGGTQQTVPLTGTGTAAAPSLTLTPESLYFPDQEIEIASAAQTLTVKNASAAAISLGSPVFPASFKGTTTCGPTLAAGKTCLIHVQFAPAAAGPVTGTLSMPVPGHSPLAAGLAGTGTLARQPAVLKVNPTQAAFGPMVVGDNPSMNLTVKNSSGLPAGIHSISLSGDSVFMLTGDNCPAVLAGGASCTVQITYQPKVVGIYSGNLRFAESSGARTDIAVSGTATTDGGSN
jgi:hypothetical protein